MQYQGVLTHFKSFKVLKGEIVNRLRYSLLFLMRERIINLTTEIGVEGSWFHVFQPLYS